MFRPKISVEIVYKNRDSVKKKCPIIGKRVIIKKGKRGRSGSAWSPTFEKDSEITEVRRFLFLKREKKRLMVIDGAEKCINFNPKDDVDLNGLDRTDLEKLANLEVIKRSGEVKIKHELPIVFWLLLAIGILDIILTIMRGNIRFV